MTKSYGGTGGRGPAGDPPVDGRWRADLARWDIPEHILRRAPVSPWGHSPARFAQRTEHALAAPEGPSLTRIAEALPAGGACSTSAPAPGRPRCRWPAAWGS
ncbi:hypothetical protein ACQP10_35530 [Streptosporangium sandarakinum]|uniref:hypothetical protein n=1 Tax=Streptosporangium sandarakinum TaxID=1260955 RepID=UPI003D946BC9